jgi:hypothetical protein
MGEEFLRGEWEFAPRNGVTLSESRDVISIGAPTTRDKRFRPLRAIVARLLASIPEALRERPVRPQDRPVLLLFFQAKRGRSRGHFAPLPIRLALVGECFLSTPREMRQLIVPEMKCHSLGPRLRKVRFQDSSAPKPIATAFVRASTLPGLCAQPRPPAPIARRHPRAHQRSRAQCTDCSPSEPNPGGAFPRLLLQRFPVSCNRQFQPRCSAFTLAKRPQSVGEIHLRHRGHKQTWEMR